MGAIDQIGARMPDTLTPKQFKVASDLFSIDNKTLRKPQAKRHYRTCPITD